REIILMKRQDSPQIAPHFPFSFAPSRETSERVVSRKGANAQRLPGPEEDIRRDSIRRQRQPARRRKSPPSRRQRRRQHQRFATNWMLKLQLTRVQRNAAGEFQRRPILPIPDDRTADLCQLHANLVLAPR